MGWLIQLLIFAANLHITMALGRKPLVQLDGGEFQMGINSSDAVEGEFPAYLSRVKPFFISRYPVTVKEFQ